MSSHLKSWEASVSTNQSKRLVFICLESCCFGKNVSSALMADIWSFTRCLRSIKRIVPFSRCGFPLLESLLGWSFGWGWFHLGLGVGLDCPQPHSLLLVDYFFGFNEITVYPNKLSRIFFFQFLQKTCNNVEILNPLLEPSIWN